MKHTVIALTLSLAACGGGGGGSSSTPATDNERITTATIAKSMQGLPSVIVNAVADDNAQRELIEYISAMSKAYDTPTADKLYDDRVYTEVMEGDCSYKLFDFIGSPTLGIYCEGLDYELSWWDGELVSLYRYDSTGEHDVLTKFDIEDQTARYLRTDYKQHAITTNEYYFEFSSGDLVTLDTFIIVH